jgi:Predicted N-acetylglucosamine kinase
MKIFAGYDSGGTKTKCVLADENGRILSYGIDGPSNFLSCGYDIADSSIRECTRKALFNAGLKDYEKIYSAYFGFASIQMFSENENIRNFIKKCVDAEYLGINNDAYIAWYGTTFGKTGIISISGTGSVTVGICEDGRWKKSGGWGYLIGDEGSGYSIGRRALQLAAKSYDGRQSKNNFERKIVEFYSLSSMRDIVSMIYKDPNKSHSIIASAARCVFELFEENDSLAVEIVEDAASEIADSIYSVYSQLNMCGQTIKIGLSGGVFNTGKPFMDMIDKNLRAHNIDNFSLMLPEVPPEVSALLLSYNQAEGGSYKSIRQKIINKYKAIDPENRRFDDERCM